MSVEIYAVLHERQQYHSPVAIRSFDDAVRDYIMRFRERQHREHRWFAIQRTLEDAIEQAALAVGPSGKRLPHQWRIPSAVLRGWADSLLSRRQQIRASKTFAELQIS